MNNDQRPQLEDFICQYCDYVSHHFSKLINHLKSVHAHNPYFIVNCGIDECRKSYKMVPKLVNHIRSTHKEFAEQYFPLKRKLQLVQTPEQDDDNADIEQNDYNAEEEVITEPNMPNSDHSIANIFLQAREEYKVSGKACEFIGQKVQTVLENKFHDLSSQVYAIFRREGVHPPELNDILKDQDELSDAFGKYSKP